LTMFGPDLVSQGPAGQRPEPCQAGVMDLPDAVIPATDVNLIDAAAVSLGCDIGELMQQAGTAVARAIDQQYPDGPILIVCGGGNNGGDGYVAARHLAEHGRAVWCWPVAPPKSPLCLQAAAKLPDSVRVLQSAPSEQATVIVDAILGAGAAGPLRGQLGTALDQLRRLGAPCVAIDLPTGLDQGVWLRPCRCLCLGLVKRECLNHGDDLRFHVLDIGLPAASWQDVSISCLQRLPRHRLENHKGQNGRVLVVAGWHFPGALELAARASLASGCDLVHTWGPDSDRLPPELVQHRHQNDNTLAVLVEQVDAVLLGPGLGTDADSTLLAERIWRLSRETGTDLVIDADGLSLLHQHIQDEPHPGLLLTPHHGEATRLLEETPEPGQMHAWATEKRVVLLKGQTDLITDGMRWQQNPRGNPRLAVGGSGDVLAGLATGLLARGCDRFDAARLAALWLCTAADACWQEQGPCYTPVDLLQQLPGSLRELCRQADIPWPPCR
jgi:ADP-dependent NAD(P)H-hydrate dehydratase / NAD(P)H-hydrate epimerase